MLAQNTEQTSQKMLKRGERQTKRGGVGRFDKKAQHLLEMDDQRY